MQDSWYTQGHKRTPFGNSLRTFVVVILFVVASSSVQAVSPAPDDLVKIQLAITIGQHYVRYAKSAPPPEPIKLCVVGPDRFATFFRQKAIRSHVSFRYFTRQIDEDMSDCHVVFLTLSNRHNIKSVLKALYGKPILTVSDHRDFLQAGGMLIADACCGRLAFDGAFRREIAKVLPDRPLEHLAADHPLYGIHFDIRSASYTPRTTEDFGSLDGPTLEGITLDGRVAVAYSRFDLGNGWEQFPHPYSYGYDDQDSLRLGTNLLVYAVTH